MNKAERDAEHEMCLAIRVWLQCPESKRPSAAALGDMVAKIAGAVAERSKPSVYRASETH